MKKIQVENRGNTVKITIICICITCVAIIGFYIFKYETGQYSNHKVVLTIDDKPVAYEEFKMHMDLNRALVMDYFAKTYKASQAGDFWTSSYSDETPLEKLKAAAKEAVVRDRIKKTIACSYGLIKDVSYKSFIEAMDKENKKRSKAIRNNEIVYGPTHFELEAFYGYYISNLQNAVKHKLEEKISPIAEEQLRKVYDEVKDRNFKVQGATRVLKTAGFFESRDYKGRIMGKQEAKEMMDQLLGKIKSGQEFEEAVKKAGLELQELEFTGTNLRKDVFDSPKVRLAAQNMNSGDISGVIEENGSYCIIKCAEKMKDTYKSFDEVKDSLKETYIQGEYEKMVDEYMKKARVEVKSKVYESIEVE